MNTEQVELTAKYRTQQLNRTQTAIAAQLLAQLHPVVIPTETVYGIAADARSDVACRKVFVAKERPTDNPLIVHFYSIRQIIEYGIVLTDMLYRLLKKFAPGPLTVVAPTSSKIAATACAGLPTVAIRIPSHPVMRDILKKCSFPLAAPSANISGAVSATTATIAAVNLYGGQVAAVVEGGATKHGVESTIVRDGGDRLRILRSGAISESILNRYVNTLIKRRLLLPDYRVITESSLIKLIDQISLESHEHSDKGAVLPGDLKRCKSSNNDSPLSTQPLLATQISTSHPVKTNAKKLASDQRLNITNANIQQQLTNNNRTEHNINQYKLRDGVSSALTTSGGANYDKAVVPGSKYRHYQPRAEVILFSILKASIDGAYGTYGQQLEQHNSIQLPRYDISSTNHQSGGTSGLLITRKSFRKLFSKSSTTTSRINIIKRTNKGSLSMRRINAHLPQGWQYHNLTDVAIVPSVSLYMRYLFFFYWAFDTIAVKTIYVELPHNVDIISSALGDRLVRSAL